MIVTISKILVTCHYLSWHWKALVIPYESRTCFWLQTFRTCVSSRAQDRTLTHRSLLNNPWITRQIWTQQFFYVEKCIIQTGNQACAQLDKTFQLIGMLRHSLGGAVTFISWQHFIAPTLNLMLCLSVCLVFYCLFALQT